MGLFGQKYGTPGYGSGTPMGGSRGWDIATGADMTDKPKKKGLFGTGIKWQDALGVLGDALAGDNSYGQASFGQRQQEQNRAYQAQQAELQRAQEWDDFQKRERFKAQNREPDALTRLMINAGIDPNSPEAREKYSQALLNTVDPITNIPLPGGDVYLGPRSGVGRIGQQAAPSARIPIGQKYQGGPTQPASGTFRR